MTFLNAASLRIVKSWPHRQAFKCERAERLGIINHVVPADAWKHSLTTWPKTSRRGAPFDRRDEGTVAYPRRARPMSPQGFERVQGLRRVVYDSEDLEFLPQGALKKLDAIQASLSNYLITFFGVPIAVIVAGRSA